jgi:hypothetical protein
MTTQTPIYTDEPVFSERPIRIDRQDMYGFACEHKGFRHAVLCKKPEAEVTEQDRADAKEMLLAALSKAVSDARKADETPA